MARAQVELLEQLSRDKLFSIYQFLLLESHALEELSRSSSKEEMVSALAHVLSLEEAQYCVEFFENYEFYDVPGMKWEMLDALPDELLGTLHTIYLDDESIVEEHRELVNRLSQSPYFLKEDARKFYLWYHYFRKRITLDQLEDASSYQMNVPMDMNAPMATQRVDLQGDRAEPLFSMASYGDVLGNPTPDTQDSTLDVAPPAPTSGGRDTTMAPAPKRSQPGLVAAVEAAEVVSELSASARPYTQETLDHVMKQSRWTAMGVDHEATPQDSVNRTIEITALDLDNFIREREQELALEKEAQAQAAQKQAQAQAAQERPTQVVVPPEEQVSRRRNEKTTVDHSFARVLEQIKKQQAEGGAASLSEPVNASSLEASVRATQEIETPAEEHVSPAEEAVQPVRRIEQATVVIDSLELAAAFERVDSLKMESQEHPRAVEPLSPPSAAAPVTTVSSPPTTPAATPVSIFSPPPTASDASTVAPPPPPQVAPEPAVAPAAPPTEPVVEPPPTAPDVVPTLESLEEEPLPLGDEDVLADSMTIDSTDIESIELEELDVSDMAELEEDEAEVMELEPLEEDDQLLDESALIEDDGAVESDQAEGEPLHSMAWMETEILGEDRRNKVPRNGAPVPDGATQTRPGPPPPPGFKRPAGKPNAEPMAANSADSIPEAEAVPPPPPPPQADSKLSPPPQPAASSSDIHQAAPLSGAAGLPTEHLDEVTQLLYRISLLGAPYGRTQIRAIRLYMQRILGSSPTQLRRVRDKLKELQSQDIQRVAPPLDSVGQWASHLTYGTRLHLLHSSIFLLGVKTINTLDRFQDFLVDLAVELGISPDDVGFFGLFNIGREEIQLSVKDCLDLFGLELGATEAEIRKAHRDLAKRYHPDKFHSLGPEFRRMAEHKMKEANMALEILLYRADRNL